jgi:hypothetical protein
MEEKIHNLMMELEGKDKILAHQTTLLFDLNNELFPDSKEFTKGCSSCRDRAYKRVSTYWKNNIREKYI